MKVTLTPISKEDLKVLISFSFEGDNALLDKYHISPGTLEHCVNHTFTFIENNKDFYKSDMKIFKVEASIEGEDIAVGYTVVIENEKAPNELYSFGIKKDYRSKEIIEAWLESVSNQIGIPYYIILWNKNTRAVNFFGNNGFIVEERNSLKKLTNGAPEMENKTLIIKSD